MSDFLENKKRKFIIVTIVMLIISVLIPTINMAAEPDQKPTIERVASSGVPIGKAYAGEKIYFKVKDDKGVSEVRYKWNLRLQGTTPTETKWAYDGEKKTNIDVAIDVPSSARGIWEVSFALYDTVNKPVWISFPVYVIERGTSLGNDTEIPKLASCTEEGVYPIGKTVSFAITDDQTGIYKYAYKLVKGDKYDPDFITNSTLVFCNLGNTNNSIKIEKQINEPGTYFLQAYAHDGAGKQSLGIIRKYIIRSETEAPTINVTEKEGLVTKLSENNYNVKVTGQSVTEGKVSADKMYNAPVVVPHDTSNTSFGATSEDTLKSKMTYVIKQGSNTITEAEYLRRYNAGETGSYTIIYSVTDNAGNVGTKTVTINLVNHVTLKNAIKDAEAKGFVQTDYTDAAWRQYTDALNNAKSINDKSTQEEIDSAKTALTNAVNTLLSDPNSINKENLDKEKDRLEEEKNKYEGLDENDYTNLTDIKDKIDKAEDIKLPSDLKDALDEIEKIKLELKPLDKTAYEVLLDNYNCKKQTDYTDKTWSDLKSAMEELDKIVKENPQTTVNSSFQAKITAANSLLNALEVREPNITKVEAANVTITDTVNNNTKEYAKKGDKISFSLEISSDTEIDTEGQKITLKNNANPVQSIEIPVTITKNPGDGFKYTLTFEHIIGDNTPEGVISYDFIANKTLDKITKPSNDITDTLCEYDNIKPILGFGDDKLENIENSIFIGEGLVFEYEDVKNEIKTDDTDIKEYIVVVEKQDGEAFLPITNKDELDALKTKVTEEGTYRISYTAVDKAGNKSKPIYKTIIVMDYIKNIEIVKNNEGKVDFKTDYIKGDSLDLSQIKVNVTYANNQVKQMNLASLLGVQNSTITMKEKTEEGTYVDVQITDGKLVLNEVKNKEFIIEFVNKSENKTLQVNLPDIKVWNSIEEKNITVIKIGDLESPNATKLNYSKTYNGVQITEKGENGVNISVNNGFLNEGLTEGNDYTFDVKLYNYPITENSEAIDISTNPVKNAGEYVAVINIKGAGSYKAVDSKGEILNDGLRIEKRFTIEKSIITVKPKDETSNYNEEIKNVTWELVGTGVIVSGEENNLGISVSTSNVPTKNVDGKNILAAAGTYKLTINVTENDVNKNYTINHEQTGNYVVNKINPSISDLKIDGKEIPTEVEDSDVKSTYIETKVYNATSQSIKAVTFDSMTGFTKVDINYYKEDGMVKDTEHKNAGTYIVKAAITGGNNYNDLELEIGKLIISKKDITVSVDSKTTTYGAGVLPEGFGIITISGLENDGSYAEYTKRMDVVLSDGSIEISDVNVIKTYKAGIYDMFVKAKTGASFTDVPVCNYNVNYANGAKYTINKQKIEDAAVTAIADSNWKYAPNTQRVVDVTVNVKDGAGTLLVAKPNDDPQKEVAEFDIQYYKGTNQISDENKLSGAPVNAGNYTAVIKVKGIGSYTTETEEDKNAEVIKTITFTIGKVDYTEPLDIPTVTAIYGNKLSDVKAQLGASWEFVNVEDGNVTVLDDNALDQIVLDNETGSYTCKDGATFKIRYKFSNDIDKTNYNDVIKELKITINPADMPNERIPDVKLKVQGKEITSIEATDTNASIEISMIPTSGTFKEFPGEIKLCEEVKLENGEYVSVSEENKLLNITGNLANITGKIGTAYIKVTFKATANYKESTKIIRLDITSADLTANNFKIINLNEVYDGTEKKAALELVGISDENKATIDVENITYRYYKAKLDKDGNVLIDEGTGLPVKENENNTVALRGSGLYIVEIDVPVKDGSIYESKEKIVLKEVIEIEKKTLEASDFEKDSNYTYAEDRKALICEYDEGDDESGVERPVNVELKNGLVGIGNNKKIKYQEVIKAEEPGKPAELGSITEDSPKAVRNI